jgi:hypothetical protein
MFSRPSPFNFSGVNPPSPFAITRSLALGVKLALSRAAVALTLSSMSRMSSWVSSSDGTLNSGISVSDAGSSNWDLLRILRRSF